MVQMGENRRVVLFSTPSSGCDAEALEQAIRASFKDVLQPSQDFFLQLKSEDWGGAFLDMQKTDIVPDRSMVKAVLKPLSSEVS